MPSSELPVAPSPSPEAPHEAYLRWATDFGLIEWVVDEDGEVFYTTPECDHECQHEDGAFTQSLPLPVSRRKTSGRLVVTAATAALATLGVTQMTAAAQPENLYVAASGETVVVKGNQYHVIPAKKSEPATATQEAAVVGPVIGTPIWPRLAEQTQKEEAEEKRVTMAVHFVSEYHDHRSSKKDKTHLKTSKRTSTNKVVPPAHPKVDIPVVIPAAKKADPAPIVAAPTPAAPPPVDAAAPVAPVADPAPAPITV